MIFLPHQPQDGPILIPTPAHGSDRGARKKSFGLSNTKPGIFFSFFDFFADIIYIISQGVSIKGGGRGWLDRTRIPHLKHLKKKNHSACVKKKKKLYECVYEKFFGRYIMKFQFLKNQCLLKILDNRISNFTNFEKLKK